MRIFVSYGSEDSTTAEELAAALANDGHDVFMAGASLAPGKEYHRRIRKEIGAADLAVFLLTPEFLADGRYTRTEVDLARKRWPAPAGSVLPVLLRPVAKRLIPAYLRQVTLLEPRGHPVADIAAAVAALHDPRLDQASDLLASGRFAAAGRLVDQVLAEEPAEPRAHLYGALVALADREPRVLPRWAVARIEGHLSLAAGDADVGVDALRLLAIVRHDCYVLHGLHQPSPTIDDLLEELPTVDDLPPDPLLVQVDCSARAFALVLDG